MVTGIREEGGWTVSCPWKEVLELYNLSDALDKVERRVDNDHLCQTCVSGLCGPQSSLFSLNFRRFRTKCNGLMWDNPTTAFVFSLPGGGVLKKSFPFPETGPDLSVGVESLLGAQKTHHKLALKIAGDSSILGG